MFLLALIPAFLASLEAVSAAYTWKNVNTGASGGYIPGVVFNTKQKGLAYLRTDIGGAYRLGPDDQWIPLLDWANSAQWSYWGVESVATDPVQPNNLYIAAGLYTNSWDNNNGTILISNDKGDTFSHQVSLPFKFGGNMPGRGAGERLVIDPNNNKVLYLGARSGNGLWRSTNSGLTWSKVTSFTAVGTYAPDPTDTSGYNNDPIGVLWTVFDTTSAHSSAGTSRIFVGTESPVGTPTIWVSTDYGATWSALPGQTLTYFPHHAVLSPAEKSLYITYVDTAGPWDGSHGSIAKYNVTSGTWTNVTPAQAIADNSYGFGGLSVDLQKPGVVMAASLNQYYPDAQLWRSLDGGATWTNIYSFSFPPPDYQLSMTRNYKWDISQAPWILSYATDSKQVGWGIEGLAIDPFDSNHFLYGTGLTLYGSHDLLKWDSIHNITLSSLSKGVEETAVLGLISPPVGPHLLSAVGDIGGWVHNNLDVVPSTLFVPVWGTVADIDYAGLAPTKIVRVGNGGGQIATSTDSGNTWTTYANAPASLSGGHVQYSANATSIVWSTSGGNYVSKNGAAFVAVPTLPSGAVVKADKANDTVFYGSYGGWVYTSLDGGATFTKVNLMGSANTSNGIAVNTLGKAGEAWFSANNGIWHTTDYGKSITGLSGGVTQGWSIACGAPSTAGGTPSLYASAVFQGTNGMYRTDNNGGSWTQIDTPATRFGSSSNAILSGDPRIYGRVYIGTNGRGIFYGNK